MDPNSLPQPQFDLPPPQHPQELGGVNPNVAGGEAPQVDESRNTEYQGVAGAQPAPMPLPVTSLGIPRPTPVAASQPATAVVADDALLAEDSDLIEKEWVQKAKAIVDHTRSDPYVQNREINKVKATYIKKRYNKDIKVNDE